MSDTTTVRVAPGWHLFAGGEQRSEGDTVTVPAEVADHWIASGWAEPATPAKRPRSR